MAYQKCQRMKVKRKTVLNLLLIFFVLSFFVTPLGDYGKELLNKLLATSPMIISPENRGRISGYDWKLKDADWNVIGFDGARGKVVFINFWASWNLPSRAQLDDVQELYDRYKDKMAFYVITDEEREDPEEMMARRGYTFPITYQIIGEPSPLRLLPPPGCYILDKKGYIVVHQNAISDWNNTKVYDLLDRLIAE